MGSNPTAGTKRDVAELADATVLGAVAARRVGSSPTISTITGRDGTEDVAGLKPADRDVVWVRIPPPRPTLFKEVGVASQD